MKTNLEELREKARQAFYWTSFDPTGRGNRLIDEYTDLINADLEKIEAATDEQKTAYISKFKSLLSSWLSSHSNCASSAITGGSGFNVRRAERANNREHAKYEAFEYWRGKAIKAILKSLEPEKTFVSEIDRLKKELDSRIRNQQIMKDCNAIIRKAKGSDCTDLLVGIGLSRESAIEIQQPDRFSGMGFASFSTTNNLASIHRIEDRIKDLEKKEQNTTKENPVYQFEGGKVVIDYSIDRIKIQHETKPEYTVISALKHGGFHWSPSNKAWQRQITESAIWKAESITGIKLTN